MQLIKIELLHYLSCSIMFDTLNIKKKNLDFVYFKTKVNFPLIFIPCFKR